MQPTLKEIAEAAGVSVRSVTRALKNEAGGNEDTYLKIRDTARRLGYIPNIAARNLRIKRKNFIGLISSPAEITITQRKIIAMQKRLESDGFYPVGALIPDSPEKLREIILGWAGLVDKVIFTNWNPFWDVTQTLSGLPMQFIFVDCMDKTDREGTALLKIDRSVGIQRGVEELINSGRRRIAYCGSDMQDRLDGFRNAFRNTQRECVEDFFVRTEQLNMDDGFKAGNKLLHSGFDAVFFATDRMAMGFLKYCYEHKIAVPGQIAVIGFDDDPAGLYSCPALSTVAHPIDAISVRVAELAAQEKFPPVKESFSTQFIARESI